MGAIRIAMWSGPRNISTAMMRSWGSRADAIVCDEPFYAHYLAQTGLDHPGRDEILQAHEADWEKVAEWLTGPVSGAKSVFYQKHMAHHFLPHMDGRWLDRLIHGFLIRDPAAMLVSLDKVYPNPSAMDTGLPQQVRLFERMREEQGRTPPVVDSRDVLINPEGVLRKLCQAFGVPWDGAMLSWEKGIPETDGVWAKHWYSQVAQTTGFNPWKESTVEVPERLQGVLAECQPLYEQLHARRLLAS